MYLGGNSWIFFCFCFFYLVPVRMSSNDDGFDPARHQPGDVLTDDGFSEHGATQNVTDGAVGGAPHLLQVELLHPVLVRCDGGTFDAHAVLTHGFRSIHRHLVVRRVTVLDTQVKASRRQRRVLAESMEK